MKRAGGGVRIAVIGCGRWGGNYVRVLQQIDGCRLVGCCDESASQLAALRQVPGDCAKTTDPRELIRLSRPDGVVIATPAARHHAGVNLALSAGAHVLVEKPMAVNSAQARRMVDLARKQKRLLMVGHILQFHGAFQALVRSLKKGNLGKLRYVHAVRTNLGPIRKDVNVLWDLGAHDISMLLALAGDEPALVTASGQSYLQKGVPDVAFATVYFKRRRMMGHLHVSWLDPQKVRRLTVIGTRRMAVFDDVNAQEPLRLLDRGVLEDKAYGDFGQFQLLLRDGDIRIPRVSYDEPLKAECAHFIGCVRNGKKPVSDGQHGLDVVRVLEALDASCRARGRPVKVKR